MEVVNIYLTPMIVIIGVTTNILSTVVFLGTHLRHQSSSIYLAALAIADSGFLVTLLIGWLSWVKILLFHRQGWCQTVIYIAYVCGFLSVWSLVAFTVERYIAVCHPFSRHVMCTVERAKIVVCALFAGAAIFYNFSIWTTKVQYFYNRPACLPDGHFASVLNVMISADALMTMVIPSLAIVLLNLRIGIKIYMVGHLNWHPRYTPPNVVPSVVSSSRQPSVRRSTETRNPSVLTSSKSNKQSCEMGRHGSERVQRVHYKTTRLLFVVSAAFLLLNGPSHAVRIYYYVRHMLDEDYYAPDIGLQLQECFQLLYYTSFSVNFFLYSFCAKRFRNALRQLLMRALDRARTCGRQPRLALIAMGPLRQQERTSQEAHLTHHVANKESFL